MQWTPFPRPRSTAFSMPRRTALVTGSSLLASLLTACGGGGQAPAQAPSSTVVPGPAASGRRALSGEFSARNAVSYSPFRTDNRETEVVTDANVLADLQLLVQGNFRLIRLFDSFDNVAPRVLRLIRDNKLDIKVMLGAYLFSESSPYLTDLQLSQNETLNKAETARAVVLANAYQDIVLAVSVGNETMVSWSFVPSSPNVIAQYLTNVRAQITQPVTTDDNWAFYAAAPERITSAIDFAAIHTYPLADTVHLPGKYDWQQAGVPAASRAQAMADASIASAKADYHAVRTYLDNKGLADMPIVIGETGWKAEASGGETYRAHPINQKMYFQGLNTWSNASRLGAGPASIFYFEAFDEPWKGGDDKWGLFTVGRKARSMVQALYPPVLWDATYATTDAVYYKPLNATTITSGRYTLFAEATTGGEQRPAGTSWNAWENGKSAAGRYAPDASAPDPSNTLTITPTPLDWGWGFMLNMAADDAAADLSGFAGGTLNLRLKTSYAGSLELGFYTGRGVDGNGTDVYLAVSPGQYGYRNDGTWCTVSIPVSALLATGSSVDLTKVTTPFVIADRYEKTGKPSGSNITTPLALDNIYWSR